MVISGAPVFASERVALVIGNGTYERAARLRNVPNDAADVDLALRSLGFDVVVVSDSGQTELRRAISAFARRASGAETAVVFYAGHGIEVDGKNYLVPTDAALRTADDVTFEAIPLDLAIEAAARASGLSVVIVDACRENPFGTAASGRNVGRGLKRPELGRARNTLVAYAASEGQIASDGDGRNSPFTAALVAELERPDRDIRRLFGAVRERVLESTRNGQEPATYARLGGDEILIGRLVAAPTESAPTSFSDPASIAEAQRLLNELGFEVGAADGVEGRRTVDGLRRFQLRYGLPVTGVIGADTLVALRVALAAGQGPVAPGAVNDSGVQVAVGTFEVEGPGGRADLSVFRDCEACPEMIVVPGGSFLMGSPEGEDGRFESEGPQHRVRIEKFALGRTEVTVGEFRRFVVETGHRAEGGCYHWVGSEWKNDPELSWSSPGFAQGDDHSVGASHS